MRQSLIDFSQARILVVGDVMLDRYWSGSTSRISPEAPVPVVHVEKEEERPGGAGNVALNIISLGAKVTLLAAIGDDETGELLSACLKGAGIHCQLQVLPSVPTVTKLRVLSRHQQLIRLDFEETLLPVNREQLLAEYRAELTEHDAVILSDYNKGTLVETREFIQAAREAGVPIFIDPKTNDYSAYIGATAVTPNMQEFESVVGRCKDENDLVAKAEKLIQATMLDFLLVTRGEHGMTLVRADHQAVHVPSQAKQVFDVTGAGDTVIATLAVAYASGLSPNEAVKIANTAAGITVGKVGAATASLPELRRELASEKQNVSGVLNKEQLLLAVETAKTNGEKIIMTNGCFDILHAGHVQYLNQAKALGDRLIVAVNDDASVEMLKGSGRPLNNIAQRMAVLASLAAVDWVVPFSGETPRDLIGEVLPDVLVKGGDYKPEEVAGSDHVWNNGGEVKILDFVEGLSTTRVIDYLQKDQKESKK